MNRRDSARVSNTWFCGVGRKQKRHDGFAIECEDDTNNDEESEEEERGDDR